eukprot:11196807-Lingulodinium_polyedra.AAC.1
MTPSTTSRAPARFQNVRSSTYARRAMLSSVLVISRSHGTSMTLRTKTAIAQPGRMPLAGAHGSPNAPSTRTRRAAK